MHRLFMVIMGGIALLSIAILIYLSQAPSSVDQATDAQTTSTTSIPTPKADLAKQRAELMKVVPHVPFVTGLEQLPASLAGTEVDGEILIDSQQNLVVTGRLRDLFDYFLNTLGEETLPTIIDRIRAYVAHRVPEPAQSQTLKLLDQYIAYRQAVENLGMKTSPNEAFDVDVIERLKSREIALRQQYFSTAEIDAFFGMQDAIDQNALASLRVQQNPNLSAAQKAAQIAQLQAQLPEEVQAQLKPTLQIEQLNQLTDEWKQRGGSAEELRQIRTNLVGAEATQRLEALDQEDAAWQQRIDQYLAARQQVLNNKALSEAQQQNQIKSLQNAQFNDTERLRLKAYEMGR
jgi:lipase chaperone LimK